MRLREWERSLWKTKRKEIELGWKSLQTRYDTANRKKGRRQWHPTPVLLPGKSHGWRSSVGCRPWAQEESDTTERLHFHFSLSCIGEGNGNPLQCSCLENPRDSGAWWTAVYGVGKSRTRLKWLSSRSSSNRKEGRKAESSRKSFRLQHRPDKDHPTLGWVGSPGAMTDP